MKKDKISILIVDDHEIVRQGLKQIFANIPNFDVIAEADCGRDVPEKVRTYKPDITLLDVGLPDKSGLDVLKELKSEFPDLKVLILSMYPEDRFEERFLKAGASGYITKDVAPDILIESMRKISRGERFVSQNLAQKLVFDVERNSEKPPHQLLSDREFQVMCLIASGDSLTKIADSLSLGLTTISTYRTRILEKMQLENNIQLTHYVLNNNLLD